MSSFDDIDERILREVVREGRVANVELAGRVGLSASACSRRVQELERAGVIRGYRAVLDRGALGRAFLAYVTVGLDDHTKASQETFERAMDEAPEVFECHNIAGAFEYLLRVEARDIESYKRFHTDVLGSLPHVNAITTYLVMGSPKDLRS